MGELSCYDAIKTRPRTRSKRFQDADDSCSTTASRPKRAVSKCARNHLYDIEIVEEEQYRVKVHYVGYSSNYDE